MWFGQRIAGPVGGQAVEALDAESATAAWRRAPTRTRATSCSLARAVRSSPRHEADADRGLGSAACRRPAARHFVDRSDQIDAEQRRGRRHALARGRGRVDRRDGAPGVSRSSSSASRTSSSGRRRRPAASDHATSRAVGARHQLVVPLPRVAVVVLDDRQADRPRVPRPCAGRRRTRGCRATSTSSRRPCGPSPRASSGARTARRWPPRTGPRSHSWCGKIRSVPPPCRSMVVPSSRSASAEHSMCQPGPARAPQRLPRRLVVGRRLPQHEVERVALVRVVDVAAALARRSRASRPRVVADTAPNVGERATRRSTPRRRPGRRSRGRAPCR